MIKKAPIPKDLNRNNLIDISIILHNANIEHFIMGGTLIGLVRDGDIIDNDDDVDFLVNISHQYELIRILQNTKYDISHNDFNNIPLSYIRCFVFQDNKRTKIDFSFYENFYDLDYIIERIGQRKQIPHIPKNMIFPIIQKEFFGTKISLPFKADLFCKFSYDLQWRTPVSKYDYIPIMIDHKPKIVLIDNIKNNY